MIEQYGVNVIQSRVGDVSKYAQELGNFTRWVKDGRELWHCELSGIDYFPEAVEALWEHEQKLNEEEE
jgi:hypothetical protein